jgi:hypothetical protein
MFTILFVAKNLVNLIISFICYNESVKRKPESVRL